MVKKKVVKIEEKRKYENVAIKDLVFAEYNPRKFSKKDKQKLKESIVQFGFNLPVVINVDNTIIGGHQRVKVAKELGMKTVPVIRVNLDKDREMALNLALNKISGVFDNTKLPGMFDALQMGLPDLTVCGFDQDEIDVIREVSEMAGDRADLKKIADDFTDKHGKKKKDIKPWVYCDLCKKSLFTKVMTALGKEGSDHELDKDKLIKISEDINAKQEKKAARKKSK